MLKIKIENYARAMQVIAQLPTDMQRKVFLPALRKSAKPMLREAISRVPKRTGKLATSLKIINVKKGKSKTLSEVAIKPVFQTYKSGELNEFYGKMVHDGTVERVPKKKNGVLKFTDTQTGKIIFTKSAAPIKANPFFEKAYQSTEMMVVNDFGDQVAKSTEKFINTKLK